MRKLMLILVICAVLVLPVVATHTDPVDRSGDSPIATPVSPLPTLQLTPPYRPTPTPPYAWTTPEVTTGQGAVIWVDWGK